MFGDPNDPQSGRDYTEMAILLAIDGQTGDRFGNSVAIDGEIIVVALIYASIGGAVYVFRVLNNISISQVAKRTASNEMAADKFGWSVAIQGNYILVGSNGVERNSSSEVGSAYLFGNPNDNPNFPEWTQYMQFQPDDLT